jgi:hypothetical protein
MKKLANTLVWAVMISFLADSFGFSERGIPVKENRIVLPSEVA